MKVTWCTQKNTFSTGIATEVAVDYWSFSQLMNDSSENPAKTAENWFGVAGKLVQSQ